MCWRILIMQIEQTYRVIFKGEILPKFDLAAVNQNLAVLFNLDPTEVLPLFEGKAIFNRSGLNKFTADQYAVSFKGVGALCHIELELDKQDEQALIKPEKSKTVLPVSTVTSTPNVASKIPPHICPKCQSSNLNSGQCLDCGIYIEKFLNNAARDSAEVSNNASAKEIADQRLGYMQKAIQAIKYVTVYMLVVFTLDNILEDNNEALVYIIDSDFYIGLLPYVLGHFGLAVACYYIALAKGLSAKWSVLGLASLPGLGIVLLLPDKNKSEPENKTKLFAITIILLSVYWVTNAINLYAVKNSYFEESLTLRQQRHEYPSETMDIDDSIFKNELAELEKFLDKGFDIISDYNLRSHEESAIANMLFSETMRLFIWINYQQYIQYHNGQKGIEYLRHKNISNIQIDIFKIILERVKSEDSSNLNRAFTAWFKGHNHYIDGYEFLVTFYQEYFKIHDELRGLSNAGAEEHKPPYFSFDTIELPRFSVVQATAKDDMLFLDFSKSKLPVKNKKVVIAFYYKVYKRHKNDKENFIIKQVQISPDFPNKYLGGELSVFRGVDIFPLLDK